MPRHSLAIFLGLLPLVAAPLQADGPSRRLTFEADIRPIFKTHCFQCHGEAGVREGDLDLRLRRSAVAGGDSGAAIVPSNTEASLLLHRVRSGEMPPGEDKRLSPAEVERIEQWISAGAPTAREEPASIDATHFTVEERSWWSFQPVQRPALPSVARPELMATPIDAFVLARLGAEAEQLVGDRDAFSFAQEADRATLIRRLYLDLLGLPPTPEEVSEFLADPRANAWETLVDRVLSSPRYGERWARHWLDVAGYADSEGYTDEDRVRENAYFYRDYVIDALNADKPYDQFVTEQLAGDELAVWPRATLDPVVIEQLAATGFLRMAPDGTASSGVDLDLARNQVLADTLQIVGTALLGMTVHCAQCHDHRYDPIPQRDYYRLRAVFEPALDWKHWRTPAERQVSLYTEKEKQQRTTIENQAKQVDAKRQKRVDFYIDRTLEHELLMVDDAIRDALREAFQTAADKRTKEQNALLKKHPNVANITAGSLYLYDRRRDSRAKDIDQRRTEKVAAFIARVRAEALAKVEAELRDEVAAAVAAKASERTARQAELVAAHPGAAVTAETLAHFDSLAAMELQRYATAAEEIRKFRIREELDDLASESKAIRDTIPTERFLRVLTEVPGQVPATHVFYRGDHQQPRDPVEPGGLSVFEEPLEVTPRDLSTSARRLSFARQLTNGAHPLLARVMVNRLWLHHFGQGIVRTPGDFGFLGEPPTHPELLDWLASEFVASGWSIKHLHRLIVTSSVYRQSSAASREMVDADPDMRLLGRWPLRRLESETLRDAVLAVAGKLNLKMHGEPVPVMEDEVGQIVLGKENLDGERKPTNPIPLHGEEFRRSVYVQVRRTRPFGVLESFDLPDMAPCCAARPSSNVAPQALMLMNSDFMISMSTEFARRLLRDVPDDSREQLRRGWEIALGKPPTDAQLSESRDFIETQLASLQKLQPKAKPGARRELALATFCQALLSSNRFLYID